MAARSKPLNDIDFTKPMTSGLVDHVVGDSRPTGKLTGQSLNKTWRSMKAPPRHESSKARGTYSLPYGYRLKGGGSTKKKVETVVESGIGFQRPDKLSAIDKDYIAGATWEYSFESPRSSMVSRADYDPRKLLMRVEFVNKGDVVIYDHVPAEAFFYLKHNAERDGHIGKIFWDVVRYRGEGNFRSSKFPYWYEFKSRYFDDPAFKELPKEVQMEIAQVQEAKRVDEDEEYEEASARVSSILGEEETISGEPGVANKKKAEVFVNRWEDPEKQAEAKAKYKEVQQRLKEYNAKFGKER
jgi:hypothetical protein